MTLPPYAALIGASVERGDEGPVVTMPFGEEVVGRPGFLHGGAIAGLLELAAGVTLREALAGDTLETGAPESGAARTELITVTVDYRRGGRERMTHAAALVTRLSRRVAHVEASAWQEERGQPIATARLTFAIRRG